jgi:hypothetical protein
MWPALSERLKTPDVGECAVYITGLADTSRAGLRRIITVSAIFRCEYVGVLCFITFLFALGFFTEILK